MLHFEHLRFPEPKVYITLRLLATACERLASKDLMQNSERERLVMPEGFAEPTAGDTVEMLEVSCAGTASCLSFHGKEMRQAKPDTSLAR